MSEIKRWDWVNQMVRGDDGGRFVKYADHEAEIARLRAGVEKVRGYEVAPLEAKVAELCAEIEENEKAINVWRGRTQRAEADAAALRGDAERYRWLRDKSPDEWGVWKWIDSDSQLLVDDSLMDSEIDAAMGEGE